MFVPWLSETLGYGNNYADKVGFKKLKLQMNKIVGIRVSDAKKRNEGRKRKKYRTNILCLKPVS